jgi:hypothetical protein
MDIDSGNEPNGKNTLREVEEREEPKAAQRGPGNCNIFMTQLLLLTGLGRSAGSSSADSVHGMLNSLIQVNGQNLHQEQHTQLQEDC